MKKLLITGVSGFLGWNICHFAPEDWQIYGTVFSHQVSLRRIKMARVDLSDSTAMKNLIQAIRPDAVIHTAAVSNADFCQLHPEKTRRINVDTPVDIAEICSDLQIPYAYTSSDLVFDGKGAPYRETDPVCPLSVYGAQKAMAEDGIRRAYPDSAICRIPLMFGISESRQGGLVEPMVRAMREGRELHLFTDEFRTPLSARDAVSGLFLALEQVKGVIHLGGLERISRFDFGKLIARVFNLENAPLVPCEQKDMANAAPRPPDVSLDSSMAFKMGFTPSPIREELECLREFLMATR